MQCSMFTRTWRFREVSCVCFVYPTIVVSHFCLKSTQLQWLFCLLWAELGPYVFSRLVWGDLGHELGHNRSISELLSDQTTGHLFCIVPWRASLVGRVCSQTRCLFPAYCWGLVGLVCVWLSFPLPRVGIISEWCWFLWGLRAHDQACAPL